MHRPTMRWSSPRILVLAVVALTSFTSFIGLYYAYSRQMSLPWEAGGSNLPTPPQITDRVSKIAKVSVAANRLDNDMIHRALRSHYAQNALHGYQHFTAGYEAVGGLIENPEDKRPRGAWTKPAFLLSLVVAELEKPEEERLEWMFWFDADTIVTNPSTPLEVFLPPASDPSLSHVHILIASNWDGLNSGAFALRVHPWTVALLSAVLAYPIYRAERVEKDRFRDQSAFQYLLQDGDSPLAKSATKSKEHWSIVPMRWFNSLPVNNAFDKKNGGWIFGKKMTGTLFDNGTTDVHDDGQGGEIRPWKVMQGDMIVHFAGSTAGGTRDSWMGPWLDRVEASLPEWNNASTAQVLREETRDFWAVEAVRVKEVLAEGARIEAIWAAEKKQKEEEARKKAEEEERKKAEEEKKKKAGEAKKDEEEKRKAEEAKMAEEQHQRETGEKRSGASPT
ncbi:glycosyltransferase family 34 protein [Sodiomyces alcalophilus JCM 7366]|uniref:glycosyltransferase family 34 protein n=1 Tax=Sodiomyces alcalophilus JCM 7366 TaxID=591952 RepID=UPI0039B3CC7B